ncbi:MAG: ABC transporter ATP-binding protein, partial [Desulfobacterales bacterium]|nr:ABC transporter ATP-binding protein [Desulfobacterales bacterium]
MLEVNKIDTFYGKIQALWGVSLRIDEAEIVALVGANGAGKTTLLNAISGLVRPASGSIAFLGKRIDGLRSHAIVALGISHIPEGRRLFPDMSVRENLEMGAYTKRVWKDKDETLKKVYQLFPILEARQGQLARTLSGGEQQMVAMGRGLMSRPRMCLIDEPSSGLAPLVVDEIFSIIQALRDQGMAIFLIEQNVQQTLEIADRAYVLENGRVILAGDSKNLLKEIFDLSDGLVSFKENGELLQRIISTANQITGAERGALFCLGHSEHSPKLKLKASRNLDQQETTRSRFRSSMMMIE